MSNDPEGQTDDEQVDKEMARADRANGERPVQAEHASEERSSRSDPDAPGAYVDDSNASSVAEPNEPA